MSHLHRLLPGLAAGLWALFCLAAIASAYDVHAPAYPVAYSDAQKDAQRAAGRAVVRRVNAALATGAHTFTVPPGVYRIPAEGPDSSFHLVNVHGFTLRMAGTEFVLENGGGFIDARDCENLAFVGPSKIDSGTLVITQGRLVTYDPGTGLSTVDILPGYEVSDSAKGTVDAFSPQGVYLENPSWASYEKLTVLDRAKRLVQVKLGAKDALWTNLYHPGALLALRIHGSPLLVSAQRVHGFTLKDVDVYTGSGIGWGGGTGDWNFIHIKGIRRPGTSRLMGAGGCQMGSGGGNVLFEGCEFSNTADDLMDYYGGGLFTCARREGPRTVVSWGGGLKAGDTVNFYSHGGFQPDGTAVVRAVADLTDPALQAEAHHLVKDVLKARDAGGDKPLRRLTLDRDVSVSAGDYMENAAANRPDHFTIRHCYFHDSGVRVMVQGFQHGLFEDNRFERISGGLALTCDAWWFEGPTCQDITVRDNVFGDTPFRNAWGTGKAAIIIGAGWSEDHTDLSRGCAFHTATVTGNTIVGASAGAVFISNTDHVLVANNVIRNPFTLAVPVGAIQLAGVADGRVWNNAVTGCPGLNLSAQGSRRVSIRGNVFRDAYKGAVKLPPNAPDAVISIVGGQDTEVTGNTVAGTDAAHAIWVAGSTGTTLRANRAIHLTAPGAVLLGTGTDNTSLHVVSVH